MKARAMVLAVTFVLGAAADKHFSFCLLMKKQ